MKYIKFFAFAMSMLILISFVGCNSDVLIPDDTIEQSNPIGATTDPSPKDPPVLPSATNVNTYIEYGDKKINILDAKYVPNSFPDFIEPVNLDDYITSVCRSDNYFVIQFTPTDDYGYEAETGTYYTYLTIKGVVDHVYSSGKDVEIKEDDMLKIYFDDLVSVFLPNSYPPDKSIDSYVVGLTLGTNLPTIMRKGFSYLIIGSVADGKYRPGLWGIYEYSTEECWKEFDEFLGITRFSKFHNDVMERYPYVESKHKWE